MPIKARKRRAIIVLGMHRSGTSALAGVLGLLGARLPVRLLPANFANRKGYFEPDKIVAIHDRILSAAATTWESWEEISEAWFLSDVCHAFVDELAEAVSEDYGTGDLCVIKDPRMCRLMPLWYRVLDRLDVEPCFAIPLRNPVEVAKSLQNRDGLPLAHGCLMWLRHVLDAERQTRGHPRVFLRYTDLLAGPRPVIGRMRTGLGVTWPRQVKSSLGEIEDFLDPSLRNQVAEERDIDDMGNFSPWLRQAYECYEALVRSPADRAVRRRLDSLHAAFGAADAAFTPVFKHHAEQHATKIAALRETLAVRQAELASLGPALAERDNRIVALSNTLGERDARLAALDQALAGRDAKVAKLDEALAERNAKVAKLDEALAERNAKVAKLDEALAERNAKVAKLDQSLAERDRELGGLRDVLAERDMKVAALDQALIDRDNNVAALETTVSDLRASTSWRITAPLRWIRRILGRLRYSVAGYLIELGGRILITRSLAPILEWQAFRVITRSNRFDRDWYLKNNIDVAELGIDPVLHYVAFGMKEGRDPSPLFSTRNYLAHNSDIAAAGVNAFAYYLLHGESERHADRAVGTINLSQWRSAIRSKIRGIIRRAVCWDYLTNGTQQNIRRFFRRVLPQSVIVFIFQDSPPNDSAITEVARYSQMSDHHAVTRMEGRSTDYEKRVAHQIQQYAETVNMHALPEIFHVWSQRYIRPGLMEIFGSGRICDVYLDAYRAACQPGRTTHILSIGCGDGKVEIELAQELIASGQQDFLITGADLSPILLSRAEENVTNAGLIKKFNLIECDLNNTNFDEPFNVIMANHSLHHIVELERLFSFSSRILSNSGVFATCDMIGRNGHLRWPETAAMVRKFWSRLTDKQRYNVPLKRLETEFLDHDCSTAGFEGIRAQDILPLLLKEFNPRKFLGSGGFIDVFVDRSFGHGFDVKNPEDVALIEEIGALNEAMLDSGQIKPTMMFAHFVKYPCSERFYRRRSARSSVRRTDIV